MPLNGLRTHRMNDKPLGVRTWRLAAVLIALAVAASCAPGRRQPPPPSPAAEPAGPVAEAPPPGHDPSNPPIDCPLHKHGIDPGQLRPFEEVEQYIAFLDSPERAVWQKPDEVVAALGLEGTETVLDLGAGSGYFSFRLARALPKGTVIASDIEPEMIRHIHHRAMTEGIGNIRAELIRPENPALPEGVDLVFICDVLHHVPDRPVWLGELAGEMRPGARLVLIEFREGDLPKGPPESMKIPRDRIIELMAGAGFVFVSEKPDLLPYQLFLEFEKP